MTSVRVHVLCEGQTEEQFTKRVLAPALRATVLELVTHAATAVLLGDIRGGFASPEEINEHKATAPSKRIAGVCPAYRKTLHGILAAEEITLAGIRAQCSLVNKWVERLEALGAGE